MDQVLGLGVDTFRRHEIPDALGAKIRDREAARLDTRRYFFAMNPEVGDPWIAGGATDDYIGGAIGLAISPR